MADQSELKGFTGTEERDASQKSSNGASRDCTRCPELVENRTQVVNGVGTGSSGLMLVGEAPGKREDEQGEPFVGRSGDILTETLQEMGLSREEVRISNVVRCRPPDNRDPKRREVENCRPYLADEIGEVEPRVLCALGRVSASALLGENVSVGEVLGDNGSLEFGRREVQFYVDYHPAATIYDRSKTDTFREILEEAAGVAES